MKPNFYSFPCPAFNPLGLIKLPAMEIKMALHCKTVMSSLEVRSVHLLTSHICFESDPLSILLLIKLMRDHINNPLLVKFTFLDTKHMKNKTHTNMIVVKDARSPSDQV